MNRVLVSATRFKGSLETVFGGARKGRSSVKTPSFDFTRVSKISQRSKVTPGLSFASSSSSELDVLRSTMSHLRVNRKKNAIKQARVSDLIESMVEKSALDAKKSLQPAIRCERWLNKLNKNRSQLRK